MNSNARKSESIANQTNFKPDQAPQAFQLIHGKRVDQQGADRIDIMIEAGAPNRHPFLDIECLYFPADDVEGMYDWYKKHFNEGNTRHRPLFYEKATHPGQHCSFQTESKVPGESYEMYVARLETDCIVPLFERVSRSDDIILEPLRDEGADGITFVFTDPQGNKFQIWQDARMEPQPLRDDVLPLIRVAALFFPASDPAATKRWYTEYLGVDVNESGNLTTRSGLEIHLCKSAVPGQTLNFVGQNLNHSTSRGEEPSMSIVNIVVDGLDDMHRRMMEDGQDVMDFIFYRGSCGRFFQLADPDGNKLEIWERQTVLYRKDPEPGSNGTSVYMYHDYGMHVTQEGYFEEVLKSTQGRIRTVYIGAYEKVLAEDPEGLHTQLERLRAFNVQYPAYALRAIYRNGNTFFRLF